MPTPSDADHDAPPHLPSKAERATLIRGGAVSGFDAFDDAWIDARPGAVVAERGCIFAVGESEALTRQYGGDVRQVIDRPDAVLLPGMVNAHTHLELTAIGPQPYNGDFVGWVAMLRQHWPGDGEPFEKAASEAWFAAAAMDGARQSLAAGVEAVGDITRFDAVAEARRAAGLGGRSFIELFGMGPPWDEASLTRIAESEDVDGFQPHAPYSAGPAIFDAACAADVPLSCHLAETRDEARFVAQGDGPFLELLKTLGKWSPEFAPRYGRGLSPVRWMEPWLRRSPWLLAHCNDVDDDDIALLAATGASVAYCPIASEYFGHGLGPDGGSGGIGTSGWHRYRDMLDAGVNVCLGTDSIVCQPPGQLQPLGMLPPMRRLFRRDRADPKLLLAMATTHGIRALKIDHAPTLVAAVAFDPGDPIDPLTQVMRSDATAESLPLDQST